MISPEEFDDIEHKCRAGTIVVFVLMSCAGIAGGIITAIARSIAG